jgi:superfamily I DNA/RNA helicase
MMNSYRIKKIFYYFYIFLIFNRGERNSTDPKKTEEKRRLFYVAATRAAKNLSFYCLNTPKIFKISRFFLNIDPNLYYT